MPWYSPWKRWQRIAITPPVTQTEACPWFPVYVPASSLPAELTSGSRGRTDGGDLAFAADLGVGDSLESIGDRVPCEVVSAVFGASPSAEIHVRLPSVAASGTTTYFWVGYDNAGQTAQPAADSDYGSQNVWREGAAQNFAGVWHFGTPGVLSPADSTSNGNHGTNHKAAAAAGQLGGACSCDGGAQTDTSPIMVSDADSLSFVGTHITISAWVRRDGLSSKSLGGLIDDPRVSSVARSPSWIASEHANQSSPQTYLALSGSPISAGKLWLPAYLNLQRRLRG